MQDNLSPKKNKQNPFSVYETIQIDFSRNDSTFLGQLKESIHNWYRETAGYSPELVRQIISLMKISSKSVIFDPFAGTGTTMIEARKNNIISIGNELNPWHFFVCSTISNWNWDRVEISALFARIKENYHYWKKNTRKYSANQLIKKNNFSVPKIHNVHRWWREDVLVDLLFLKQYINTSKMSTLARNIALLALGSILVDTANVERSRLQLHFIDKSKKKIHLQTLLYNKLDQIIKDIHQINQNLSEIPIYTHNIDSTKLHQLAPEVDITHVVCSPPYPNRYSYVWNTRPHLFFFDFFSKGKESSELDCQLIGGTWGRATFGIKDIILEPVSDVVENAIGEVLNNLRSKSNLMANYALKYFNDLYLHFSSLQDLVPSLKKVAYVVGNSRLKGIDIFTDQIILNMLDQIGFDHLKSYKIRSRNSKPRLYEAIAVGELK